MKIHEMEYPAPYFYFGGKSKAAPLVWSRFGQIERYIEPFFGSGSMLLKNQTPVRLEIVNDCDHFISNFWRTIKYSYKEIIKDLDFPRIQVDLTARHKWLVENIEKHKEKIQEDPFYHDVQIASFWIWGSNLWIGNGWGECVTDQKPRLNSKMGLRAEKVGNVEDYLKALSNRLKDTVVLNGDWTRCFSRGNYLNNNTNPVTGVFLDPPYSKHLLLDNPNNTGTYKSHDDDINKKVFEWALENGERRDFRIALCGYDGEYNFPESWDKCYWHYKGGYTNMGKNKENAKQETIWFSPYCHKGSVSLLEMMIRDDD